ncbi:MAG: hypothetical protein AAF184_21870 [Pseudomonadota bacterium]
MNTFTALIIPLLAALALVAPAHGQDTAATETEPNDRAESANALDTTMPLRGVLTSQNTDYFRFSLGDTDSRRDILFSLDEDLRTDTCLLASDGTRIKCLRGTQHGFRGVTLSGEFVISISAVAKMEAPVGYTLTVSDPVPNPAGEEVEPNDRATEATLVEGMPMTVSATLSAGDKDLFRFSIPGPRRHWRIAATGQSIYAMELLTSGGVSLQKRSGKQPLALDDLFLPPGDYLLATAPSGNADVGAYEITIAPAETPPGTAYEEEPNDTKGQAQRLTLGSDYSGQLSRRDTDMYRFHLPGRTRVRVTAAAAPGSQLNLSLDGERVAASTGGEDQVVFEGTVRGGDHLLRLRGRTDGVDEYRLRIDLADPLAADGAALSDVAVAIVGELPTVGAYHPLGQRVPLALDVHNTGSTAERLEVLTETSDVGWRLRAAAQTLDLAPGERTQVDVVLDVLPDARTDTPVLVSLGVRNAEGAIASTSASTLAVCGAPPVSARRLWSLPDALLGGTNAAWAGLGATIVDETRHSPPGIDGIITRTKGAWMATPGDFTVDLAGTAPLTVLGTVLHPTGSDKVGVQLRRFELLLSDDGTEYRSVFTGALRADAVEQAFVLPAPERARFARLRLIDNIAENGGAIGFGEWKVIVAESPREILGGPLNIADHAVGGHTVYSTPYVGGGCCHTTFNTEKDDGQFTRADTPYEWVMGFRDNRAARIEHIQWRDGENVGSSRRAVQQVSVSISMDSPVGPWTALADWQLSREQPDVADLPLAAPVWARFVRFVAAPLEDGVPRSPAQIRIFEAASDARYLSVVGEWGHGGADGPYERQLPQATPTPPASTDAGDSRSDATALRPGDRANGTVLVGEDEDWYAVTVAEGNNQLRWRFGTAQAMEYAFDLVDAEGVALKTERRRVDDALEVTAAVTPGTYYLRLYEPPRSVIFSWDTSGSVGPYYDVIDHTMKAFAAGVREGREEVNLVPFNDPAPALMLEEWSGDAYEVSAAIVNSDRRFGSSNAESALILATNELSKRDGTRAVMFITDAETDGLRQTGDLWRLLGDVRPRVFSFELSSKGNPVPQDMMQNYAAVNRGFYDLALTAGDLQIGFDRAICLLRRAKDYHVAFSVEQVDPPEPGALLVKAESPAAKQRVAAGDAVEVIIDASGSMYKKLGDRFRYQIAADVLDELLAEVLPDGIGFALRAFGNREASSCRTDLEVPLGALDRSAARAVVAEITPQAFAYTPIAASIAKVPEDLAAATGRKTVVLITDGEESCDGDVEAQIEALRGAGVDVQLNVIGFDFDAQDTEAARATFQRWAALGGGSYFDAASASELARSLTLATSVVIPYEVKTDDGVTVASGTVNGDEITLPPGRYTVHFADDAYAPEPTEIASGTTSTLLLD